MARTRMGSRFTSLTHDANFVKAHPIGQNTEVCSASSSNNNNNDNKIASCRYALVSEEPTPSARRCRNAAPSDFARTQQLGRHLRDSSSSRLSLYPWATFLSPAIIQRQIIQTRSACVSVFLFPASGSFVASRRRRLFSCVAGFVSPTRQTGAPTKLLIRSLYLS